MDQISGKHRLSEGPNSKGNSGITCYSPLSFSRERVPSLTPEVCPYPLVPTNKMHSFISRTIGLFQQDEMYGEGFRVTIER